MPGFLWCLKNIGASCSKHDYEISFEKNKFAFCGIQVCIKRIKFPFGGIQVCVWWNSSLRFTESSLRFVELKFASNESSLRVMESSLRFVDSSLHFVDSSFYRNFFIDENQFKLETYQQVSLAIKIFYHMCDVTFLLC